MTSDLLPPIPFADPIDPTDTESDAARRFTVADVGAAEWAMRHLAAVEIRRRALLEQRDHWLAQIREWYDDADGPLAKRAEFFRGHLERFGVAHREANPREATIKLPSGTIPTTDSKPKVVIEDEAAVIAWARAEITDPEQLALIVKVKESALVSGLRSVVAIGSAPANQYRYVYACGHSMTMPGDDEGAPLDQPGPRALCPACNTEQTIESIEPVEVGVVVDRNGQRVPGAGIDPGGITARVVPDV